MPPVAGEQVGPYLIERELGRGGMGVVYLARDTRLDRAVAIKALPEDMAADPERLARFEREARSLAQLSHPSIASIYGVEEHAGDRYLVLEFVEGETLEDRLDRGPLPPDEAVELAAQIAGGLAVAHDAGVIHRDLKPANVIVTPEGRAAILDFGLARIDEGRSSTSVDRDAATLTTPAHSPTIAGVIMGTAAYMSPEQARGRRVDKRSDVWSFGVVLYEMLTGLRPFAGETVSDSIGAILHKTIDLDRLPDGTPPNAARVIERCTARDRDDRYRDLGDARLDLLEPAGRAASGAEARRPGGVGPLLAIALAAVFGAAGLLAGLLQGAGWGERTEPTVVDLVAPDGYEFEYAMLSPDGRTVAARCDVIGSGVDAWFIRDLDTPAWRRLPDSERSANGTFSPDGRYFVYKAPIEVGARDSRLLKLDLESDLPPTEILAPPVYLYEPEAEVHWLRSGELFLQSDRGRSILPIDPETGEIGEPLALRRAEGDVALDLCESVVPGLILAEVTRYTDRGYQNDAVAIVLATGEVVDLVPNARPNAAADGLLYFSRFDTLFAAPFDIETLEVGTPRQIGTDLRTYNPWEHAFFSLSEAGDLLHLPGGRVGLRRLIKRGTLEGELVTLPFEPRSYDDRLD
ncbi:MAG: serine/threonine-protein kinase, partial [Planctomycetota bacterium]